MLNSVTTVIVVCPVRACVCVFTGSSSDGSLHSGSVDAKHTLSGGIRQTFCLISMRKTLALIYLALVWSRQALTLGDLLRFLSHTRTGSVFPALVLFL